MFTKKEEQPKELITKVESRMLGEKLMLRFSYEDVVYLVVLDSSSAMRLNKDSVKIVTVACTITLNINERVYRKLEGLYYEIN